MIDPVLLQPCPAVPLLPFARLHCRPREKARCAPPWAAHSSPIAISGFNSLWDNSTFSLKSLVLFENGDAWKGGLYVLWGPAENSKAVQNL